MTFPSNALGSKSVYELTYSHPSEPTSEKKFIIEKEAFTLSFTKNDSQPEEMLELKFDFTPGTLKELNDFIHTMPTQPTSIEDFFGLLTHGQEEWPQRFETAYTLIYGCKDIQHLVSLYTSSENEEMKRVGDLFFQYFVPTETKTCAFLTLFQLKEKCPFINLKQFFFSLSRPHYLPIDLSKPILQPAQVIEIAYLAHFERLILSEEVVIEQWTKEKNCVGNTKLRAYEKATNQLLWTDEIKNTILFSSPVGFTQVNMDTNELVFRDMRTGDKLGSFILPIKRFSADSWFRLDGEILYVYDDFNTTLYRGIFSDFQWTVSSEHKGTFALRGSSIFKDRRNFPPCPFSLLDDKGKFHELPMEYLSVFRQNSTLYVLNKSSTGLSFLTTKATVEDKLNIEIEGKYEIPSQYQFPNPQIIGTIEEDVFVLQTKTNSNDEFIQHVYLIDPKNKSIMDFNTYFAPGWKLPTDLYEVLIVDSNREIILKSKTNIYSITKYEGKYKLVTHPIRK